MVIKDVIKSSGYRDAEAIHILREILTHEKIPYGDAVRIGLIGDAGVGKSSVINSVLGKSNLTLEVCRSLNDITSRTNSGLQGDDSESCTYVAIEFAQPSASQDASYAAEVHFFCLEECIQIIIDFAAQIFKANDKRKNRPDELDDMETEQANTALECLQKLFANHNEFADEISAEKFLSTARSAKDQKVLYKLHKWTSDILHKFVPEGKTSLTMTASNTKQLREKYVPFVKNHPNASFNGEPLTFTPWPLVQKVR